MTPDIIPPTIELTPEVKKPRTRWFVLVMLIISLTSVAGLLILAWLNTPSFEPPQTFTVSEGESVREVTSNAKAAGLVRSEMLLYATLLIEHGEASIKASTYVIDTSLSTREFATLLTEGDFDNDLIRLTLPEGERVSTIAKRASNVLSNFSATEFETLATPYEGRLFPDTYFIPADYTEEELFSLLTDTFVDKFSELTSDSTQNLSESEIITIASIIEREANSPESKGLVAGILLNRLALEMPLQTDASIEYVLDKPLNELAPGELATLLETLDSPYNTYLYSGLPPTPIGNPGLDALNAVINPTTSNYLYYITGEDGEFYYAESYAEHLNNIERYLR